MRTLFSVMSGGMYFPIYEAHFESEIKDSLETVQTPFEANESIFLSTDGRAMQKEEKSIKSRFKVGEHVKIRKFKPK
jgi:hypothetical protein